METAGGKYPHAKSCVMSLVTGMVEFITACFSRPQRNEESSLRAQKISQAMVLTSPTMSVWLSSPRPLKQLWVLSPVDHSGLKWKGDFLHPSQAEKGCRNNNLRALPGILICKWTLVTKQSAILGEFKACSWRKVEECHPDPLWSRRLGISGDVCPEAPI